MSDVGRWVNSDLLEVIKERGEISYNDLKAEYLTLDLGFDSKFDHDLKTLELENKIIRKNDLIKAF